MKNTLLFFGIGLFYFLCFWLLPKLLRKQKFVQYITFSVLMAIVPFLIAKMPDVIAGNISARVIIAIVTTIVIGVISITACRKYLKWLLSNWQQKKDLEKKNTETELALLKAQLNPHFLFNTLNNIDILIEKDAQKASVYLKELSDMLRFMLYESPAEKIALLKEVEYISKYIELQKIRTANQNYVSFEVEGDTGRVLTAPMLYMPFIENAFKHSSNKKIDHAIEIKLLVTGSVIVFYCSNAYDPAALQAQPKSGLGLELMENRLKLLYKNDYTLKIDKTGNRFSVSLTINTNGNQLYHN